MSGKTVQLKLVEWNHLNRIVRRMESDIRDLKVVNESQNQRLEVLYKTFILPGGKQLGN